VPFGTHPNGTYLSPKEAFSVSITEFKDSETPALESPIGDPQTSRL